MGRFACIHGHFYQPPRENPWLERIELQDSAYPYHDWNERITEECYAPNSAARLVNYENKIIDIVSNYAQMSFNFGPTLFSWMEANVPEIYEAILEADRISLKNFNGHGSAIAQCYNHMIMPLANVRDKETQVIWGIRDFEYRFKRKPEGMWLPETAVDLATLDILSTNGIKFTILAPNQASEIRKIGETNWQGVFNFPYFTNKPYLCHLPSGRTIVLFFYSGSVSHDVAFGNLLSSGENFGNRLIAEFSNKGEELVHVAMDGETFGHHKKFGDMALAACLRYLRKMGIGVTVYGDFLEKNPPLHEVKIFENSSWSCAHGVERWRSNCGCNAGGHGDWNQEWRALLRKSLDFVRDSLNDVYEKKSKDYFKDPWHARNEYVEVILKDKVGFFEKEAVKKLTKEETVEALKLLEMQRNAMLMYTSCGWFFDEISGIETIQIMEYAARAVQLSNLSIESSFLDMLKRAKSNIKGMEDGAKIYGTRVKPLIVDLMKVAAHFAISSLFEDYGNKAQIFCYEASKIESETLKIGHNGLTFGVVSIFSQVTFEEKTFHYVVLHLGDQNIVTGIGECSKSDFCKEAFYQFKENFFKGDISKVIQLIEHFFPANNFLLSDLFKDEQRKILNQLLDSTIKEVSSSLYSVLEQHYSILNAIRDYEVPLPNLLQKGLELYFNSRILDILEGKKPDLLHLQILTQEINRWHLTLDKTRIAFASEKTINQLLDAFLQNPKDLDKMGNLESFLKVLTPLNLELDLWRAQNYLFSLSKKLFNTQEVSKKWNENFLKLASLFYLSLS